MAASPISVSVGPFISIKEEKRVESVLKKYKFLSVRDQQSFNLVSEMNLPYQPILTTDIAGTYRTANHKFLNRGQIDKVEVIGVALCSEMNMKEQEKQAQNNFIDLISKVCNSRNVKVRVFEMNGHKINGDHIINEKLVSKIKPDNIEYIPYSSGIHTINDKISKCDFMFCSRLHAGIMSYMANVPFVLFEYHKKCTDFLDYIKNPYRLNFTNDFLTCFRMLNNFIDSKEYPEMDNKEYRLNAEKSFSLIKEALSC
nr:polysaccharide pyruvyl transferase family protein [Escherichia coli]